MQTVSYELFTNILKELHIDTSVKDMLNDCLEQSDISYISNYGVVLISASDLAEVIGTEMLKEEEEHFEPLLQYLDENSEMFITME